MKGAGSYEQPGAHGQRTGNPARLYGYPRSWVRNDPRDRDPQAEILASLQRIEALLVELVRGRLP